MESKTNAELEARYLELSQMLDAFYQELDAIKKELENRYTKDIIERLKSDDKTWLLNFKGEYLFYPEIYDEEMFKWLATFYLSFIVENNKIFVSVDYNDCIDNTEEVKKGLTYILNYVQPMTDEYKHIKVLNSYEFDTLKVSDLGYILLTKGDVIKAVWHSIDEVIDFIIKTAMDDD